MSRSRLVRSKNLPDTGNLTHEDTKDGEIVVDPTRQSGLNLWRELRISASLLGSDALVDEFSKHGLHFFKKSCKVMNLRELE